MAKIQHPDTISSTFALDHDELVELGVIDATLAIDTRLFVDPLLLSESKWDLIRIDAAAQYREHFTKVIKFLAATQKADDVAWRSARRLLEFHEITGTCLGYGAATISGSGFGPHLTDHVLRVGKEIVDLGVRDPDLFTAMALFEEGIGPDRLSDMTTTVIRDALVQFNKRVLRHFGLKGEGFLLLDSPGEFLVNPHQRRRTPVIFVPSDIVRPLPIAHDWDGIADAAAHNESLRRRVNQHVAHLWELHARREKRKLRDQALSSKAAFQTLLDAIHVVERASYDTERDSQGLIRWARIARQFAERFPLQLTRPPRSRGIEGAYEVVAQIVTQFRQLVEHNGLNKELYERAGKPRHESSAQRLFFAVAYSYCKANDLDISPEVDSGNGKIDFKMSHGFKSRILVEIKLSTNKKLVTGFEGQLGVYKRAEETMRATYLVIDVGKMGNKKEALLRVQKDVVKQRLPVSELEFVDGRMRPSASKRQC